MEFPEIQQAIEALPAERRQDLLTWMRTLDPPARRTKPAIKPGKPATVKDAVLWTVVTVAAFLLLAGAIFRSGWYNSYLETNSTTGHLDSPLFRPQHHEATEV